MRPKPRGRGQLPGATAPAPGPGPGTALIPTLYFMINIADAGSLVILKGLICASWRVDDYQGKRLRHPVDEILDSIVDVQTVSLMLWSKLFCKNYIFVLF